jgi:prepilin-type N-terminal cleavage/methylation domain-containing protein
MLHRKVFLPVNRQAGFSLLELLVVISIIGILVAISTVAFNVAQRSSRDGRRRADIKAMQSAFEQYRADNTAYAACGTMADYDSGVGVLMPGGLPTDPKNTGSYVYNTSNGCDVTGYCVCALLETGSGNADAPTAASCNYAAGGDYYCLTNLQ